MYFVGMSQIVCLVVWDYFDAGSVLIFSSKMVLMGDFLFLCPTNPITVNGCSFLFDQSLASMVTNLSGSATSQVTRRTRRLLSQTSPPFSVHCGLKVRSLGQISPEAFAALIYASQSSMKAA